MDEEEEIGFDLGCVGATTDDCCKENASGVEGDSEEGVSG
jgi:hypothetical protein